MYARAIALVPLCLAACLVGPPGGPPPVTPPFAGRAVSRDGSVTVSWRVEDGYRISLAVDTKARKGAYHDAFEADVYELSADFADVNRDGRMDVLVKLEDEGGFSPRVLVGRGDGSFETALEAAPYVMVEFDVTGDSHLARRGGYALKATGGVPELVFTNALIDRELFRDATYRWDRAKGRFVLHRRGESLGSPMGGDDAP
jgi:hypothetical protein